MRLTCEPLIHDLPGRSSVPVLADGVVCAALTSHVVHWRCRERLLEAQVLSLAPIDLPNDEPTEPVPGAIARLTAALRTSATPAVVILRHPAAALGAERIAFAEGVRLFAVAQVDDEHCWDTALGLGQPVFGVRGTLVCHAETAGAAQFLESLIYGLFWCEDGATLAELHEDRRGVRWRVADAAATAVTATAIIHGGFAAAAVVGNPGTWEDRGNERYVRVAIEVAGGGRCWTQPRFVAPMRALHG